MRLRLAHVGLCSWLLVGQQFIHAQQEASANDASHRVVPCPLAPHHDEPPSGPEISISNVTFSGFIQMPISDQQEIADSIKRQRYSYPLDGVVEEALERVKAGWQNHGYFKTGATGDAKRLTTSTTSIEIALFVHVEENAQYRLGEITFKNNKVLSDAAKLRDLFPIKDAEVFSREKIAEGLENLRKVYGEYGYINYTGVPATTFDDEKKVAHLEIDVDEGKQFLVSGVEIEGLDEPARQKVLRDLLLKPGQVYNSRLWERSLLKMASLFPGCECRPSQPLHLDEGTGTVAVTLDFRPCSAN
jgi:outer membrane protein assembly factor BamA